MELQRCPFLQKCRFSPQTDVGHAINGNDVVTIGLLELPFTMSGQHFTVNCRIMRGLVRPIVLGWDFLCNRKAIINLETNNLTIKGISTPFLIREKPPSPLISRRLNLWSSLLLHACLLKLTFKLTRNICNGLAQIPFCLSPSWIILQQKVSWLALLSRPLIKA